MPLPDDAHVLRSSTFRVPAPLWCFVWLVIHDGRFVWGRTQVCNVPVQNSVISEGLGFTGVCSSLQRIPGLCLQCWRRAAATVRQPRPQRAALAARYDLRGVCGRHNCTAVQLTTASGSALQLQLQPPCTRYAARPSSNTPVCRPCCPRLRACIAVSFSFWAAVLRIAAADLRRCALGVLAWFEVR